MPMDKLPDTQKELTFERQPALSLLILALLLIHANVIDLGKTLSGCDGNIFVQIRGNISPE